MVLKFLWVLCCMTWGGTRREAQGSSGWHSCWSWHGRRADPSVLWPCHLMKQLGLLPYISLPYAPCKHRDTSCILPSLCPVASGQLHKSSPLPCMHEFWIRLPEEICDFINACSSSSYSWLLVAQIQRNSGCPSSNKAIHIQCNYTAKLWRLCWGFRLPSTLAGWFLPPAVQMFLPDWSSHPSVADLLSLKWLCAHAHSAQLVTNN